MTIKSNLYLFLSFSALFYSIETETGHRLSLTGNHFIAVDHSDRFLPANKVNVNDIVFIHHHGQLQPAAVRNITEEYKVGYFTPMTGHGSLLCYSNEFENVILSLI